MCFLDAEKVLKRQPNFTAEELEVLLNEVESRSKVLFGKFSGAVSMGQKEKGWEEIARAVSGVSGVARSKGEVKRKFTVWKSQTKTKVFKKHIFLFDMLMFSI